MKKIKIATLILGIIIFLKVFGLNLLENLVVLKIGVDRGLNLESILIMVAFSLLLYYLIEGRK